MSNNYVVEAPYHPGYEDVGFKSKTSIRHKEPSYICSLDDDVGPNDFLMQTTVLAVHEAWKTEIKDINPDKSDSMFYNVFPGEHYRFLKALARNLNPRKIIEVGTYTGMGTVALHQGCPTSALFTFDIIPWEDFDTHLENVDATQFIGDLSDPEQFEHFFPYIDSAELLFIDAPKDGIFEYKFAKLLTKLTPRDTRVIVFDDIRFVNMMTMWRGIKSPKLDISSFGHWSGTGIVDASKGFIWEE